MCFNQTGNNSTIDGSSLKLVDKFTYWGSSVSSIEKDIDTRLTKAWTAIDKLSIIWKSDLTYKMKRSFFQAAVTSILLYGCTTWTLTKRLEKKLDSNYTWTLRAILNKSWRQHPTKHQLYGHQPPITKTILVRRTRHARHCLRIRDELISDILLWTPTYGREKQGDPLEHTYRSYVIIRDVALKTCQRQWTIGRSGERGSGIYVLAARHYVDIYIYIYIYMKKGKYADYIYTYINRNRNYIYIYIYIYISSSYRIISTDIPDPFSRPLPIVHCFRQVLMATPPILTELLYVGSSWSPCFYSAMWKGP